MHHPTDRIIYPTDRIIHTTAFVTPVVEHWLEREIAPWVHPMKDQSEDPSHLERMPLPHSYILHTGGDKIKHLTIKKLGGNIDRSKSLKHTFLGTENSTQSLSFLSARTAVSRDLNENIGLWEVKRCISNLRNNSEYLSDIFTPMSAVYILD